MNNKTSRDLSTRADRTNRATIDDTASPGPVRRRRRDEYKQETRNALLAAGRQLFARRGYAAVSMDDVAAHAGLTKGALYHHFKNKRDLFRAILEALETELVREITHALDGVSDPWHTLTTGLRAFLQAATRPAALRIITLDGPSVLGWGEWREIDTRHGLALVSDALRRAMQAGVLKPVPVQPLAHVLLAALTESALLIADAEDQEATATDVETTILTLIEGLRVP